MSMITIPKAEYDRLVRSDMAVEILSIYVSTEEYPHESFIEKVCNHALVNMPFSTPDAPEDEGGWHE